MSKNKEYRSVTLSSSNDSRKIAGIIPYNSPSEDLGFIEYLDPDCFTKTLREMKDCTVLYQHNEERPLARTKNGSLRFNNTKKGLEFEFDVPNTTDGNDLLELVHSGVLSGCSFGFQCMRDKWSTENGKSIRRVFEARLFHISPVTTPAYEGSSIYCRSLSEAMNGKELTNMDKEEIRAEIEKLQAMLAEEPMEEKAEEMVEEPIQEAKPMEEEASCQKREDTPMEEVKEEIIEQINETEMPSEEPMPEEKPQVDMKELEELLARLAAAEEKIRKYCNK